MLFVHKISKLALLMLAVLSLGVLTARATTFLQFQSTYLGDGWFQYQMSVLDDPYFSEADITGLTVYFPGEIGSSTTSTNWSETDSEDAGSTWSFTNSTWSFTNGYPVRPYQETFLVQSSDTTYKLGTNIPNSAVVILSLFPVDFNPMGNDGLSQNIVGYATLPCLVPCSPDEADNSPTNFVFILKLLPDVGINQLIQTNGNIYGIDFTWGYDSTFVLQASADLNNWTNVAYIWSYPPETIWTTNTPLNNFGNFFRISLVGSSYDTNPPALNSSAVEISKALAKNNGAVPKGVPGGAPKVTGCSFSNGKVLVNVATAPGEQIQIQATDAHLAVQQTQQVIANGTVTTATFDAANLPSPVFFQAKLVP